MQKFLAILTLATASLFGQIPKPNVTVQDTMYLADGTTPFNGVLTITWPQFTLNGQQVGASATQVFVISGVLSVVLWPSDQALVYSSDTGQPHAGFVYQVTGVSPQGPIINQWFIASTFANTTVTLSKVRATTASSGGATPAAGGADFLWGPVAGGSGFVVSSTPNDGVWIPFTAKSPTMAGITYRLDGAPTLATAGFLVGVFAISGGVPTGSALCSAVTTITTSATAPAFYAITFSSPCTSLVMGQQYVVVLSTDNTTWTLECADVSFPAYVGLLNANYHNLANSSHSVSNGTGLSMTFTSSSGWTAYQGITPSFIPNFGFWN